MTHIKRVCAFMATMTTVSLAFADDSSTQFDELFYKHIPTVITAPLLGPESSQDGSDLLYGLSSTNHDLSLLKMHQLFNDYTEEKNISSDRPTIILGGAFEGNFIMDDESTDSFNVSHIVSPLNTRGVVNKKMNPKSYRNLCSNAIYRVRCLALG